MSGLVDIDYRPPRPRNLDAGIALVGCGWIASEQVRSYRACGFGVVGLLDREPAKARALRDLYYPQARVYGDLEELLADGRVRVVDITTHPDVRVDIVRQVLSGRRHVLSQKPFAVDLEVARGLIDLARMNDVHLAVNQNGRWAPHFSYLLACLRGGQVGRVFSADFTVNWPHDLEMQDKPVFAAMRDLVLYDFGIHWFDIVAQIFSAEPYEDVQVQAASVARPGQLISAATLAHAALTFPGAQATLAFRGSARGQDEGRFRVEGSRGAVEFVGSAFGSGRVTRTDHAGITAAVDLEGEWFTEGFQGAMGELLCAVEDGRPPSNAAERSVPGLAMCFAALESDRTRRSVGAGSVTRIPG